MNSFFPPVIQVCTVFYSTWLQLTQQGFSFLTVGLLILWWLYDVVRNLMNNKSPFVITKSNGILSDFIDWIRSGVDRVFRITKKHVSYGQTYVVVKQIISIALLIIFI